MTSPVDFTSCERLPGRAFIDSAPLLTDLQRRFYKTYLAARHKALFAVVRLLYTEVRKWYHTLACKKGTCHVHHDIF